MVPTEDSGPPNEQLRLIQEVSGFTLGLAARLHQHFALHAAGVGLTPAQAKLLVGLQPGEPVSQRALADRLGFDPSNLTGLIDKLEERGAVQRRPDEVDRRIKVVALTDVGRETRREFWERLTHDAGPMAHLSTDQARELRDRLSEALAGAPPEGPPA